MAEGNGLENRRGVSSRGFESHPLCHEKDSIRSVGREAEGSGLLNRQGVKALAGSNPAHSANLLLIAGSRQGALSVS